MTEPFDTLMRVQEHDTTLDQLRHRMETLAERAELGIVLRRRTDVDAALAEVKALVDDLSSRQRQLEDRIAAAAGRRHEIEQRMLRGDVTASRDLQAMDAEVHQLSTRQERFEDEEMALLEEEEPLDALLAQRRTESETLAADGERLEAAIADAEAELTVAIAAEEALRAECASGLPEELARRYEMLRSRMGGVGAARLVGDRCDGCHLTLPAVEVERIRLLPPDEFATCDQCDQNSGALIRAARSAPPMLILVRHGESTGNAEGLLLGRMDAPLTERGLRDARALGPAVANPTRVISSPLARARATAEALDTGLPVEIDDRWVEVDYGDFDGQALGSVPAEVWRRWRSDPGYRPPGGETLVETGTRVREACEELFATEGEGARDSGPVVVVSHVSPIKAATCWALGLADQGAWRLYLATASLTRIGWGVDGPVLHRFNETVTSGAP